MSRENCERVVAVYEIKKDMQEHREFLRAQGSAREERWRAYEGIRQTEGPDSIKKRLKYRNPNRRI